MIITYRMKIPSRAERQLWRASSDYARRFCVFNNAISVHRDLEGFTFYNDNHFSRKQRSFSKLYADNWRDNGFCFMLEKREKELG
jgi:hypothetical protein